MEIPERVRPVLDECRPLAERFAAAGHRVYLVGGIVRDLLAGRSLERPDLDLTTDARPEQTKALLGGWADTASPPRYRSTSAANPLAVSYRRVRSFSSAFITIQSSSPRIDEPSRRGSLPRLAEIVEDFAPSAPSRVLGVGGCSSRMILRISSKAARRSVSASNGVVPVSSSYSRTPSE